MNNYVINKDTLAIVPYLKGKSIVYENNHEYIVNKSPRRIISLNCDFNGSSFEIRKQVTSKLTGDAYKVPMLLNNKENIIMFPTESPRLNTCCWINYKNIKCFYNSGNGLVTVKFNDGHPLIFSCSANIIRNQILKSNYLNFRTQKI